jgi:urease accessory protein
MSKTIAAPAAILAALTATPVLAHVGAGATSGFASGFMHPILGPDHVLAMVAVGLWAGMVGARAMWAWPAAFVGMMVLAGVLGMSGVPLPFVEPGILASVIVLGLAIAMALRAPVWLGAVIVGFFALFHGHAHGTEVPETVDGLEYLIGFALATALLHGIGIALCVGIARVGVSAIALRALGGLVVIAGIALAVG